MDYDIGRDPDSKTYARTGAYYGAGIHGLSQVAYEATRANKLAMGRAAANVALAMLLGGTIGSMGGALIKRKFDKPDLGKTAGLTLKSLKKVPIGTAALFGLGAVGVGAAGAEYIHQRGKSLSDEELGAYKNMMDYGKYASVANMAKATAANFEKKANQSVNGDGNMSQLRPEDIQKVVNLAKTAAANMQEASLTAEEVQAIVDQTKVAAVPQMIQDWAGRAQQAIDPAKTKVEEAAMRAGIAAEATMQRIQGLGQGAYAALKSKFAPAPAVEVPVKAASVKGDEMTKIAELQDTVEAALIASEALYKQAHEDAQYAIALFQEAQAVKVAMDNGAGQNPALTTPTAQEDPLAQTFSLGALAEFMKKYQDARRAAGTPT